VSNAAPAALITRPSEDAGPLAEAVAQRGYRPLIEPLLHIVHRPGPPLRRDALQALLVTSANGVRALAARLGEGIAAWRDLPVFAVGEASALAARQAGFRGVRSAGGDVASLAALVAEQLDPNAGPLLHAAASQLAGDLAGTLARHGFTVEKQILYDALPAEALSPALAAEMRQGKVRVALFFSPRTAASFVKLAQTQLLSDCCAQIVALALSPAVAAILAPIAWRKLVVAEAPRQDALLAALDGV